MARKSKFTEKQMVDAIRELDAGAKPAEVGRRLGVTEATLYRWKQKYGGMELADVVKLKQLEDENRRLKAIVADQALDIQGYRFLLGKR